MDYSLISVRYAKALYSLSIDKNISEKVNEDMQLIKEQYGNSNKLSEFLNSAVIPKNKKKKLFQDVFGEHVNEVTMKFLTMLVDNNREGMLQYITLDFIAMYKKEQQIKTVTLYTAIQLDKEYITDIQSFLAKELKSIVELEVVVREHLIGGFMLMLDGKLIDTTISSKLKQIKKQLLS